MRARTRALALGAAAAVAGAAVCAAVIELHGGGAAASTPPPVTGTATVTRTDLSTTESVSGTLEYTGSEQVLCQTHGMLTSIAAEGSTVSRGQTLFDVDDTPVVLMYGTLPMWRTLTAGVSGPDVVQLDGNLIALGYATRAELGTGDTYTSAETAAVKRWQAALGVDQTGNVQLGAVDFLPGAIRMGSWTLRVGQQANPGMVVSPASDTTRSVDVPLDASKQALVNVSDQVRVELPTGVTVPGTVSRIARVAVSSGNGGPASTIDVTVTLPDQSRLGSLDAAPVDVVITTQSVQNVLAVPITALTVLPDGTYAVDVVDGSRVHRVAVTTGLFSNSEVQVSGSGLEEGQSVEVPSV
ncbi:MAG TPA: hypothetical protein VF112_08080 [Candidatus Dormibacteraeota bacterium]